MLHRAVVKVCGWFLYVLLCRTLNETPQFLQWKIHWKWISSLLIWSQSSFRCPSACFKTKSIFFWKTSRTEEVTLKIFSQNCQFFILHIGPPAVQTHIQTIHSKCIEIDACSPSSSVHLRPESEDYIINLHVPILS